MHVTLFTVLLLCVMSASVQLIFLSRLDVSHCIHCASFVLLADCSKRDLHGDGHDSGSLSGQKQPENVHSRVQRFLNSMQRDVHLCMRSISSCLMSPCCSCC